MFMSDLRKCLVFLKVGCHQPQNCASHESVCEDHWVHLCLVLFVLTEMFAVFQAIHASGKRRRNNPVRPSAYSQLSAIPQSGYSGLSLPDLLKMLGFGLESLSLCERVGNCDSCISTLFWALAEGYSVLCLISSTSVVFLLRFLFFFLPFSIGLRNWHKVVKRTWRSYSLHEHKEWILQAITLRKEPLKW